MKFSRTGNENLLCKIARFSFVKKKTLLTLFITKRNAATTCNYYSRMGEAQSRRFENRFFGPKFDRFPV